MKQKQEHALEVVVELPKALLVTNCCFWVSEAGKRFELVQQECEGGKEVHLAT